MDIADVTRICRLCAGDLCTPTTTGINVLDFPDIRSLVKEHYSVEILPTDKCTTSICMQCYMKVQKRNEFRLKYKSYKKRFRMNQLILRSQMAAFAKPATTQKPEMDTAVTAEVAKEDRTKVAMVDTPGIATVKTVEDPAKATVVVENANESLEEPITEEQFEAQVALGGLEAQVAPTPTVIPEPQEETREDSVAATERSEDTLDEHVLRASLDLLRPVIVDCLKEPLYLEALKPVFLSKDPNSSLVYHCSKCFHVFTKRIYLKKHMKRNSCSSSCRYCKTVINSPNHNHVCSTSRRCAAITGHIWVKSQYRSDASDVPCAVLENDSESEASTVDLPFPAYVDTARP